MVRRRLRKLEQEWEDEFPGVEGDLCRRLRHLRC
jgi:hypothetical protein